MKNKENNRSDENFLARVVKTGGFFGGPAPVQAASKI
jgi:hypothetical protein